MTTLGQDTNQLMVTCTSEPTTPPPSALSVSSEAATILLVTMKNFIGGLVGGGCEAVVGYPLETVKARMQVQSPSAPASSSTVSANALNPRGAMSFQGPMDCLQKSIQREGFLSLYRGASPQIFRMALSTSVMFGLVGQYRYLYEHHVFSPSQKQTSLVAAAATAGLTEALLYTPFELIKIRMQTQVLADSTVHKPLSNWQCVKQVYRQGGLARGLYRGFVPTAKREMFGNTVYFVVYETLKQSLMQRFGAEDADGHAPGTLNVRSLQIIAFSGGMAGAASWWAIFPIDTIKSVMQGDRLTRPRYNGVLRCAQQLYREGGVARFYRGLSPTLLRAFPADAATFVALETTLALLDRLF